MPVFCCVLPWHVGRPWGVDRRSYCRYYMDVVSHDWPSLLFLASFHKKRCQIPHGGRDSCPWSDFPRHVRDVLLVLLPGARDGSGAIPALDAAGISAAAQCGCVVHNARSRQISGADTAGECVAQDECERAERLSLGDWYSSGAWRSGPGMVYNCKSSLGSPERCVPHKCGGPSLPRAFHRLQAPVDMGAPAPLHRHTHLCLVGAGVQVQSRVPASTREECSRGRPSEARATEVAGAAATAPHFVNRRFRGNLLGGTWGVMWDTTFDHQGQEQTGSGINVMGSLGLRALSVKSIDEQDEQRSRT